MEGVTKTTMTSPRSPGTTPPTEVTQEKEPTDISVTSSQKLASPKKVTSLAISGSSETKANETDECPSTALTTEEENKKNASENSIPDGTAIKEIELEKPKTPPEVTPTENSCTPTAPASDPEGESNVAVTNGDVSALPELRKFNQIASVVPIMPASKRGWMTGGREEGGGSDPPSRTGTRKDLFLAMKSKRAFHALDDMKTIVDSLLYDKLQSLLFCMKCSGIFFVRKNGRFGKSPRECLRSFTPLQMYCLLMFIILTLNFFRLMMAFDPNDGFGNTLFLKFLTAIFMYESVSRPPT